MTEPTKDKGAEEASDTPKSLGICVGLLERGGREAVGLSIFANSNDPVTIGAGVHMARVIAKQINEIADLIESGEEKKS